MGFPEGIDALLSQFPRRTNWFTRSAVIGGTSKTKYPVRHRERNPTSRELAHERVILFSGNAACDTYDRARLNTSGSCSNSRMRLLISRSAADSAEVILCFTPSSMSIFSTRLTRCLGKSRNQKQSFPESPLDHDCERHGQRPVGTPSDRNWAWWIFFQQTLLVSHLRCHLNLRHTLLR